MIDGDLVNYGHRVDLEGCGILWASIEVQTETRMLFDEETPVPSKSLHSYPKSNIN